MRLTTPNILAALVTSTLLLSACGGSGGGGDPAPIEEQPVNDGLPTSDPEQPSTDGTVGSPAVLPDDLPANSTEGSDPVEDEFLDDVTDDVAGVSADDGLSLPADDDCSVLAQNQWVDATMRDVYLFYSQVPEVDPASYASTPELLDDLIVNPPDRFTFIAPTANSSDVFSDNSRYGIGLARLARVGSDLRVALVDPESPLELAGLKRGETIELLNDIPPDQITPELEFQFLGNGTPQEPRDVRLRIRNAAGQSRDIAVSTAQYTAHSAFTSYVYEVASSGLRVGYLPFHIMLDNASEEVAFHVNDFLDKQIGELVIDFRYNPGGLVSEALDAASQFGGQALAGQLAASVEFNDRYTRFNEQSVFPEVAQSLELPRLIFLVSDATASAAELIINDLKPYVDVVVIGTGTTAGKPFYSVGFPRCGDTLFPLVAVAVNSRGESVINGIAPDCLSVDTVQTELGDPAESVLQDVATFIDTGNCAAAPVAAKGASPSPWQPPNQQPAAAILTDLPTGR